MIGVGWMPGPEGGIVESYRPQGIPMTLKHRNCQNCFNCKTKKEEMICKAGQWNDRKFPYTGEWSRAWFLKVKARRCPYYEPVYPLIKESRG